MSLVFSREQVALIRQGKLQETLVPASTKIKAGSVRSLRRRYMRHDEDGNEIGWRVETVRDSDSELPVLLTILDVMPLPDDASAAPRYSKMRVRFVVGDVRDRQPLMRRTAGHTMVRALSIDPDAPLVPEDVQAIYSREGRERDALRAAVSHAEASLESQVADLQRRADAGEAEAAKDLFVIRQRLAKAAKRRVA
jgi:hypothetical protein